MANPKATGLSRSGVYRIVSPNGSAYVGSAVNLRIRKNTHFHDLKHKKHKNGKLSFAADWFGIQNLNFEVVLFCEKKDLLMYEQICIDGLRSDMNEARIAGSRLGTRQSDATKAKISAASKGHSTSEEARLKISEAKTGVSRKPFTDEHLAKMSAARRGKKHTEDTKLKIRFNVKAAKNRSKILNSEN